MTEEIILTELKDSVFIITLNRPKANAFNSKLIMACIVDFKQVA